MAGAPLFGSLGVSGIGQPVFTEGVIEAAVEPGECYRHNLQLLAMLSEGEHSEELMRLTREDARLGRMTVPRPGAVVLSYSLWVFCRACCCSQ